MAMGPVLAALSARTRAHSAQVTALSVGLNNIVQQYVNSQNTIVANMQQPGSNVVRLSATTGGAITPPINQSDGSTNLHPTDPSGGVQLDDSYVTTGDRENAEKIYNALIEAGYSPEAAAILGNLDVEHGFSTGMDGDQGSVGLAQWLGGRKKGLLEFAGDGDPTDIDVQIQYMINVDLPNRLGKEGVEKLKNMTNFVDATDYVCHYYESPANYKSEEAWANSKYGPNFKEHDGSYMIKWEYFVYSEETGTYELHLDRRRNASNYWYKEFVNR